VAPVTSVIFVEFKGSSGSTFERGIKYGHEEPKYEVRGKKRITRDEESEIGRKLFGDERRAREAANESGAIGCILLWLTNE
jgi:hypothetical protein